MILGLGWLGCGGAAVALAMTAWNQLTWPSRPPAPARIGPVSVCVPARNELRNIEACVRAILADPDVDGLWVCDDGSTDGTSERLQALAAEHDRLHLITGKPLPPGWVGKPHACAQLGAAATGELIVFVDADTRLRPGAVGALAGWLEAEGAGAVSALPAQRADTWAERLLIPFLHLTYTSWLPLTWVARSPDPRVLAVNGQVFAFRRAAYRAVGGFGAVASEVVDDMAMGRALKAAGVRLVFADGRAIAETRMYTSFSEIWRGFSKNVFEGLGAGGALIGVALYALAFVLPYGLLVGGLWGHPAWLGVGAAGVAINLALRALLAWRFGHHLGAVLAHPLGALVVIGLAINSWRWNWNRRIEWAGRVYERRQERVAEPPAEEGHGVA